MTTLAVRTEYTIKTLFTILLMVMSYSPVKGQGTNIGNLPMGYDKTWTAKLLFNSEGGYAGNNSNIESDIHGWSKLYEAQLGDVYQISIPTS